MPVSRSRDTLSEGFHDESLPSRHASSGSADGAARLTNGSFLQTIISATFKSQRYDANAKWEQGSWGTFHRTRHGQSISKLESYGLVARLPPPNIVNALGVFQNRYVLLSRGL